MAASSVPHVKVTVDATGVHEEVARELFEALCTEMPRIAQAVNGFADQTVRECAFNALLDTLRRTGGKPEQVDLIAVPQWGDAPTSAAEVGKLATWIMDKAPTAWRESIQPGESTVDAAIRFLTEGDNARTELLLVRHALGEHAGFPVERTEGDLVPLIRELASDPPPVAPEVEQLATYLRGQAEPGESVAEAAIRLIERLRQGRPALIPRPEVEQIADGLHADPDQIDDRGGAAERQPDGLNAAVEAYKDRTGLS